MKWQCDEHGTQILRLDALGGGYVWVQGRRPYCDRGHWEWGVEGFYERKPDLVQPSYYFMRKERAINEIEQWLAQLLNAPPHPVKEVEEGRAFSSSALDSQWTRSEEGAWEACVASKTAGKVRAHIAPLGSQCIFTLPEGDLSLDHSDRFPRVYMRLDTALIEAEELLEWRLLKHPAEIPGPLQEPDREIGEVLRNALQKPALTTRPRAGR